MSVDSIIQKIKQDADDKATVIREEVTKKKADIEKEKKACQSNLQEAAEIKLAKDKEKLEAVTISSARQKVNLEIQETKRELLNKVIKEASDTLHNVPANEYISILATAIKNEMSDFSNVTSVRAPKDRKQETEEVLKSLGIKASAEYDDTISAGAILVGENFTVDLTFASLFANKIDEITVAVASELFSVE